MTRHGDRDGPQDSTVSRCVRPRERAFTLVELLVVLAVIGVLMALLLPAVQAAREAARRAQCLNNLRQIGLALQNYHSAQDQFPPGSGDSPSPQVMSVGWHVAILPYMEEQGLSEIAARHGTHAAVGDLGYIDVPTFVCPSDSDSSSQNDRLTHNARYIGIAGANPPDGAMSSEEFIAYSASDCGPVFRNGTLVPQLHGESSPPAIGLRHLTDGSSHTMMVGERTYQVEAWPWGSEWLGQARRPATGLCTYAVKNAQWPINSSRRWRFDGQIDDASLKVVYTNDLFFGSQHPNGALFLAADGHVEFLTDTMDFATFQNWAIRNDGNGVE